MNNGGYKLLNIENHIAARISEAKLFSNKFGSFTKTDFEILMFTAYLDSLPDEPIYDYLISQQLGITESKVRNLRIKSQLVYPKEVCWKEALASAIRTGSYNEMDNTLTITIEDPSCHAKVRYEIESSYGGTANLNLNRKQLTIPIESILSVVVSQENNKEKILDEWNKAWLRQSKNKERITRESLTKRVFKGIGTTVSFIGGSKELFETTGNIVEAIMDKVLEKN